MADVERQTKDGTFYRQVGPDEWQPVIRTTRDGKKYRKVGPDDWAPVEEKALKTKKHWLQTVVEQYDKYISAPTRAAIGAAQETKDPIQAAYEQFGEDPTLAPTGEDIVRRAGVPDTDLNVGLIGKRYESPKYGPAVKVTEKGDAPTLSGVAGFGMEMVADPLMLTPPGIMAKTLKAGSGLVKRGGGMLRQSQKAEAAAEATAKAGAEVRGGDLSVEMGGEFFKQQKPRTLEELRNWKPAEGTGALVGQKRLKEIEEIVPDLEAGPLNYHYEMMTNPKKMKELKNKFESLPTEDAQKIAAYNQSMVDESAKKIGQTTLEYGGNNVRSYADAGTDFIDTAKAKYKAEKQALGPAFQKFKELSAPLSPDDTQALIVGIAENSKLGQLLKQNEKTGRFVLGKNTPRSGLSSKEYNNLKAIIDDLNDGASFADIQNMRDFLRKAVDPMNPGEARELINVRQTLLRQLEELSGKYGDEVKDTFTRYAKNERARESVEKIIGGKIETLDKMYAANPEKVLDKIFSNPNYTQVVREYVGDQKMREMTASYINKGIEAATDSARGFSPEKFRNWLNRPQTQQFLKNNVDQEVAERLGALSDYGYFGKRFLDEVNPSGTAASLAEIIQPSTFSAKVKNQGILAAVSSEVAGKASAVTKQRQAVKDFNQMITGVPDEPGTGLLRRAVQYRRPGLVGTRGAGLLQRESEE